MQRGYSGGTDRVQWGTGGVQEGYSSDSGGGGGDGGVWWWWF